LKNTDWMKCNYLARGRSIKSVKVLLLCIICILMYGNALFAQSYWMQDGGSSGADEGYSISVDNNDNTYTTGYFTGTASFGAFNVTALGVSDVFVAKTNSSGVYQWVVKGGDGGSDRGLAIGTDASGNSYVTGYYYGTAKFGAYTITSAGLQDIFVVKYDPNGNVQWLVSAGGSESDIGNGIAIDNLGNVVITGQFTGTATFGGYTLHSTNNNTNVFTAKLNGSTGSFMWAKSGVGGHTDIGLGVACDLSGNVYVTGQFSDTITFDNPHYSPFYNAIFVIKYNSSGTEQWFTKAGGGTLNIATSIAVDKSSNVYITGNFTGTLTFYANVIATLTNTYPNRIFVAKYDLSGNLKWDVADGSTNGVNSNSISLDGSGNPYIMGNFECIFNGYADHYGQGTFNSVGKWDIYVAEYSSSSGAWQWSRQIGGHGNNYGYSIAVDGSANIFTAGSFDQDMIVTDVPGSFLGYNVTASNCNQTYCSDPYYGYFSYFNTVGNLDVFIAKPINLNRQPYDFYLRSGNACNRPQEGVCIGTGNACMDTAKFCVSGTIYAIPRECPVISPNYTYSWSNGSPFSSIGVSKNGWYSVKQTSVDGCFTSKDSIYVLIHPDPAQPTISDNVVINTNSTNPKPIRVCDGPVTLTGGNYNGNSSWYWTTPNNVQKDSVKIKVGLNSDSGYYCFNVVSAFGCTNQTCVWVAIDSAFKPIKPKIACTNCKHDSAFLCQGNFFTLLPYDSISNPLANPNNCMSPPSSLYNKWQATPSKYISYASITSCFPDLDENNFYPTDSGWFHIIDTIVRSNACGIKKNVVTDSIFVRLYPIPQVQASVTGGQSLCPNDSEWIVAHVTPNNAPYRWSNGSTKDSIKVGSGSYSVSAMLTSPHGCVGSSTGSISVSTFTLAAPAVNANPVSEVICPNDSVELICTGGSYQEYQWYGPSGPLPVNTPTVYVKAPGSYYCDVGDTLPCPLSKLSNTVSLEQYATPYLQLPPSLNICPGDSIVLTVESSNNAVITWLPPLSGNALTQTVKKAGTYSVQVVSCGITTLIHVAITQSTPYAIIAISPSKTLCNPKDSVLLSADTGMAAYIWSPGANTNRNIYVKTAATYTLNAIDAFGCVATSSVLISPPVKDTIMSPVNVSCKGSSTGSITLSVSGGAPAYTYRWSPNVGTGAIVSNLSAGFYSVTVTDANGCAKTASVTLTQPPTLLTSGILSSANVNCFGNTDGAAVVGASGGEPAYTYSWMPGNQVTAKDSGISAGTYTVVVTDLAGCSLTSTVDITQPNALVATLSPQNASCIDTDGVMSALLTGGTSPYLYKWNPGGSTNSSIANLKPGKYQVTVTDAHGCVDTLSGTIGLDNTLTVIIAGIDTICKGQSFTLTASGANSYVWSNASTAASITVSPPANVIYWVKGTIGVCTDSVPHPITLYNPLLAFMPRVDSVCPGKPVILQVYVSGGKPAYLYSWSNGITNDSPGPFTIHPTASATYSVNITDGCKYDTSASIYVGVFPKETAAFKPLPDTVQGGHDVTFVNSSKDMNSYFWNFGDGSSSDQEAPEHKYINPGEYVVTLTGYTSDGCPDTVTEDVYVTPEIYIPNVFTPNGDGVNDILYFIITGTTCFHCNIYNRWGQLVYELYSEPEGWPGIIKQTGLPASDGTYYYIIHYCDYKNVPHDLDGFVTLIRDRK